MQKLKLPRDRSRPPLVSATFNMVWVRSGLKFAGLGSDLRSNPDTFSNFELDVYITALWLQLHCSYQSELLTNETVQRWITYFETMLESIASNPEQTLSRLALIPESEREQLLATWSNNASEFPRDDPASSIVRRTGAKSPRRSRDLLRTTQMQLRRNRCAGRTICSGASQSRNHSRDVSGGMRRSLD